MHFTARLLFASQFLGLTVARPSEAVAPRTPVDVQTSDNTYDYVIVGGGVTGLIVANRLTENKRKSVLVIEAGGVDDHPNIRMPQGATYALNESLFWGYKSEPEPELENTTWDVRVAKTLGGGSVVNGVIYDRGAALDYDAWEALGNKGWGRKGMLPFFKKGTEYVPPPKDTVEEFGITWDPSGPLKLGLSDFQYPDIKDCFKAFEGIGAHKSIDGNNGEAYGASWYPQSFDPRTGERSHARNAYYDPGSSRRNFHVMLQTVADELALHRHEKLVARGVKVTDTVTGQKKTIYARKEVILAAGSINTVKILQLSGIGPKALLEAAGIEVKLAHDGVGANFQDHPYTFMGFDISNMSSPNPTSLSSDPAFNASAWAEYESKKTGPLTQARGNALAFISLPEVAPSNFKNIINQIKSLKSDDYLPAIYKDSEKLLKGAEAQRKVFAQLFGRKEAAVLEVPVTAAGSFVLVALEKPLSRGTVGINPKNPRGPPQVLFNTLTNPTDKTILAESVRYVRRVWARPELEKFNLVENSPGAQHQTDEEIISSMVERGSIWPTLAHPSCSCAMMPEDLGGCVSDQLKFYGVDKLSIVDASILPLVPSQHIQATMYAVGEKAAHIIANR